MWDTKWSRVEVLRLTHLSILTSSLCGLSHSLHYVQYCTFKHAGEGKRDTVVASSSAVDLKHFHVKDA